MVGASAVEPALDAAAARKLAAGLLGRSTVPAKTLLGMIDLCRRTGALDAARALAEKLLAAAPDLTEAQRLHAAFEGRLPTQADVGVTPAPFVRRLDFLHPDARSKLFADLAAALPRFQASRVDAATPESNPGYARAERSSRVLYDPGALADPLLEALSALLTTTVYPRFGVDPAAVRDIDVQATYHGDGAYFRPHSDSDRARTDGRSVSFVYYLHGQPRAFTGGDLILYDADADARTYARDAYTRVSPDDNSLIVFPSAAVHEVQEVTLPDAAPTGGRLTLNGWVLVG